MNQQKDIIRDARVLGTPKMLLLGLQHMFAMFGATILVPILVNSYFQSTSQVLSVPTTCPLTTLLIPATFSTRRSPIPARAPFQTNKNPVG